MQNSPPSREVATRVNFPARWFLPKTVEEPAVHHALGVKLTASVKKVGWKMFRCLNVILAEKKRNRSCKFCHLQNWLKSLWVQSSYGLFSLIRRYQLKHWKFSAQNLLEIGPFFMLTESPVEFPQDLGAQDLQLLKSQVHDLRADWLNGSNLVGLFCWCFFVGILRDPHLEGFKPCLEADDLKKFDLKTSSCGCRHLQGNCFQHRRELCFKDVR